MPAKKPPSLALAFTAIPSKTDPAPSIPGFAARPDGSCAVTRHEGVCLFSEAAGALVDTYVETRLRHQEVALHETQDRFVVWTKTSAVIVKTREVIVFARDGAAFLRLPIWSSGDVGGEVPVGAGFVGDRVVVAVRTQGRLDLHVFAPNASGYEREQTLPAPLGVLVRSRTDWAVLVRSGAEWRACFVSFAGPTATLADAPIPSLPPSDIEAAAMNDARLVIGMPRVGRTGALVNEGAAALYRRQGMALEPIATLRPTKSRKYLGFGAIPSVCGDRIAVASLGWERVPKSHNDPVPRASITSVFDASGLLLAEAPPRTVTVESVARSYAHVQITREHVLELDTDGGALRAYALPSAEPASRRG